MDAFWTGFEKQAGMPAFNLKNTMLAGIPLGATIGALSKRHTDKNPEAKARADKALLSQKRTGIHPALMGAMVGPLLTGASYGMNRLVGG